MPWRFPRDFNLHCKSEHVEFQVTCGASTADGFYMGSDDDKLEIDGKAMPTVLSYSSSSSLPNPFPKQFSIGTEKGKELIRVASKGEIFSLETGSKVAVRFNRGGRRVVETATCDIQE